MYEHVGDGILLDRSDDAISVRVGIFIVLNPDEVRHRRYPTGQRGGRATGEIIGIALRIGRDDGFQVQMRMRINDARQQQHAGGIDLARAWRGHKPRTNLHDFLAADSDVGQHAPVFVDDKTVMNDQLPRLLRLRRARLHHQGHRQAGYGRQAGTDGGGRSAARPRS